MLRNMTVRCCKHEVIKTTLPKAKELRRVAEPIITLGKTHLANRAWRSTACATATWWSKLFDELGSALQDRNGGYLRILKIRLPPGRQRPDGARRAA